MKNTNSDSLCFSNLLSRNSLHKNKLIHNLRNNLSLDKLLNKTKNDKNQKNTLQTIKHNDTISTCLKKDESTTNSDKKKSSLGDFLNLTPSSEIKLNNESKF